jgi:rare lipoprotein A
MLRVGLFFCFLLLFGCADNQPVVGPYPTQGRASWYTARRTASGERFNRRGFTCAIRKFDFGKFYRVCNVANNKCVVVRHNDFGPAKRMYLGGRIIDLSKPAFSRIADLKEGIIEVTVDEVTDERK